ncbi:hypothetical protein [Singulisphaera sp. GP187]|uniref:hypothetical protein n=1 Tax=Singulisphaera sp. GP187 TaxID=1882752 RepID=UPI0020B14CDD|nr:hypothetical protein [Singulisphaera sp. GP187]
MNESALQGVEVSWQLRLHWSGIRVLMVAFAVIGSGLDVVPVPILAAVGFCTPLCEELDATDCEGERDEAPDDLNDLTWSLVPIASRSDQRWLHPEAPGFLQASWPGSGGTTHLQTTPLATAVPTSIRLCRFMC